MRQTPLKRTAIKRKSRLKPKGARADKKAKAEDCDQEAAKAFHREVINRAMSVGGLCERCYKRRPLQAHHIVPRSRAKGWALLHSASANGAALCADCHSQVHGHQAEDWNVWLHTLAEGIARVYELGLASEGGEA